MTLREMIRQDAKQRGHSEKKIAAAECYADAVNGNPKEILDTELLPHEIERWQKWIIESRDKRIFVAKQIAAKLKSANN